MSASATMPPSHPEVDCRNQQSLIVSYLCADWFEKALCLVRAAVCTDLMLRLHQVASRQVVAVDGVC